MSIVPRKERKKGKLEERNNGRRRERKTDRKGKSLREKGKEGRAGEKGTMVKKINMIKRGKGKR